MEIHVAGGRSAARMVIAGRFELAGELGAGGEGAVYRAFDRARGQHVALKVLRDVGASSSASSIDARALIRFKREFRLASRMRHPNCVRAYVFGECALGSFFVMDLAEGGQLHEEIARGPRPLNASLAMALQLLEALDYIHSRRIVHRDLKPANVLLREAPRSDSPPSLLLSDFGIAKVGDLADEVSLGRVVCTPAYAAPEALLGEPSDPRVDLYAFGIILYKLLTGHHPLKHDNRPFASSDWMRAQLEVQPIDARELAPDTPAPISELLMQLLSKAPEDRPRTAAIVHDTLRRWLPSWGRDRAPLEGSPYLAAPRLVGREVELAAVNRFVSRALAQPEARATASSSERAADRGLAPPALALMLSGEAGAGKSRLLDQCVRATPPGTVVAIGRCRSEPGSAFDDAGAQILLELEGAYVAARRRFAEFDETATLPRAPEQPRAMPALAPSSALRLDPEVGAAQLLALGSAVGCLVVVEDAQWLDSESIRLLVYLMRVTLAAMAEGTPARVAFIFSHRPAQQDNQVNELCCALDQIGAPLLSISLQPLASYHVVALVSSMLMTPRAIVAPFCRALFSGRGARAGDAEPGAPGDPTPLYVTQVLELLLLQGRLTQGTLDASSRWRGVWNLDPVDVDEPLPTTVKQAIGERAARLSVQTQRALTVASVIGRRFHLGLLSLALAMNRNQVLDLLEEAAEAGFLVREADAPEHRDAQASGEISRLLESAEDVAGDAPVVDARFAFVHDRHREALYERQAEASRQQTHARLAETIAALHGADPAWAAELFTHSSGCNDHARAYHHGREAASHAVAQGAPYRAVALLAAALAAAARAGIVPSALERERYADLCVKTGRFEEAKESYRVCLGSETDPERRLEILRKAGECDIRAGEYRNAAQPLLRLLDLLGYSLPSSTLGRALRFPAYLMFVIVVGLFPWLRRTKRRPGPELARMNLAGRVLLMLGESYFYVDPTRGFYVALRGGVLAATRGPSPMQPTGLAGIGLAVSLATGLHRVGRGYRDAALSQLHEQAPADQAATYASCMGISLLAGELHVARSLVHEALRAGVDGRDVSRTALTLLFSMTTLRQSGRLRSALAVARAMRRLGERSGHEQLIAYSWSGVALSAMVLKGHPFIPQHYEVGIASARRRNDQLAELTCVANLAFAAALAGDFAQVPRGALLDVGERCLDKRLASPVSSPLSCVLAATALSAKSEPLSPAERRRVARFARRAHRRCMSQGQERVVYLGARAALLWLEGRRGEAERLLTRAIGDARSRGMVLHETLVHRLFAQVTEEGSSEREHHLRRYEELERTLSEEPPDAELESILRGV